MDVDVSDNSYQQKRWHSFIHFALATSNVLQLKKPSMKIWFLILLNMPMLCSSEQHIIFYTEYFFFSSTQIVIVIIASASMTWQPTSLGTRGRGRQLYPVLNLDFCNFIKHWVSGLYIAALMLMHANI